jgi:hypothetical protein
MTKDNRGFQKQSPGNNQQQPQQSADIKKYRVEMRQFLAVEAHIKDMEKMLNEKNAEGFNLHTVIQCNAVDIIFIYERR